MTSSDATSSDATSATARDEGQQVPVALAPLRGNPRFPLADGARALATISVVLFHAGLTTHALGTDGWRQWLGALTFAPELFFVLSAFLLYRPFVASRFQGTPRHSAGGFARNRILRIFPAYWVAITVFAIYPGLKGDVFGHIPQYYGLAHIYFSDTTLGGLGVSWTVCTEISFYFVMLPLVTIVFDRLAVRMTHERARAIEIAFLVLLIPLTWLYVHALLSVDHVSTLRFGWSLALPGTACFFAAGMMLAHLTVPLAGRKSIHDRITNWPLFTAVCWGLAVVVYIFHMEQTGGGRATRELENGLIAVLVLAPALLSPPKAPGAQRFLGARPLPWLALTAYGTYLAHFPTLKFLEEHGVGSASFSGVTVLFFSCLAISMCFGTFSYYVIEAPILRFKSGHGKRKALKAAAADTSRA